MKQFICLLILLIGVLNTHGNPLSIGVGGGIGINPDLENIPGSIEGIIHGGIGSSNSSETSTTEVVEKEPTGSSSVPTVESESSSASAASTETPAPSEPSSSETTNPPEPSSSETTNPPTQSSTEAAVPPEPSESSTEEETISSEGSTEVATTESGNSTESTKPTTPAWENPNTCLGSCPAVDSYDSVYLVNERCDKFCQCSNGRAIVLSCPDGLHFNRKLNVCDWPVNAKCVKLALLN